MAAAAAQHGACLELISRPDLRRVAGKLGVAGVTRKPVAAAFESDRDNVVFAVVMSASRFVIEVDANDRPAANFSFNGRLHRGTLKRSHLSIESVAADRAAPAPMRASSTQS